MPTTICPECHEDVFVESDCEQGDTVACDECGSRLVVVGLDPIELDLKEEADADDRPETDGFGTYDFDDDRY
jgi:alpha-aminoadipate carrier protein LysW